MKVFIWVASCRKFCIILCLKQQQFDRNQTVRSKDHIMLYGNTWNDFIDNWYLLIFFIDKNHKWDKHLGMVTFSYNTSVHKKRCVFVLAKIIIKKKIK